LTSPCTPQTSTPELTTTTTTTYISKPTMVANNNATDDFDGTVSALDAAMPTNEEELEAKARILRLKDDDAGNNKESPASSALSSAARDDPDLLPEERWNEAWQSHLEFLKVCLLGRNVPCPRYACTRPHT
jgi:hypothetical protein